MQEIGMGLHLIENELGHVQSIQMDLIDFTMLIYEANRGNQALFIQLAQILEKIHEEEGHGEIPIC